LVGVVGLGEVGVGGESIHEVFTLQLVMTAILYFIPSFLCPLVVEGSGLRVRIMISSKIDKMTGFDELRYVNRAIYLGQGLIQSYDALKS
jgi:hypothetical protein